MESKSSIPENDEILQKNSFQGAVKMESPEYNAFDTQTQAQWYRQSNANPSDNNEEKQWTPYTDDQNKIVEQAFVNEELYVEIGDYLIRFVQMIEVNKNDFYKQRPIKRNTMESSRSQRFTGIISSPRTISEACGTFDDFIKILEYHCKAKQHESSFQAAYDEIQSNSLQLPEFEKEIISYILSYVKESLESEDVQIIRQAFKKTYTEQSFLYQTLNKNLREENWQEITKWSHYLIILLSCYDETVTPDVLYRGTKLPLEQAKKDYIEGQIFSWNSLTSASTNIDVAINFSGQYQQGGQQFPILFRIAILQTYNNIMPLQHVSAYPEEEEYLLPPGSIFRVESTELTDNAFEITLELVDSRLIDDFRLDSGVDMVSKDLTSQTILEQIKDENVEYVEIKSEDGNSVEYISEQLKNNKTLRKAQINVDDGIGTNELEQLLVALGTTQVKHLIIYGGYNCYEPCKHLLGNMFYGNYNLQIIDLNYGINFDDIVEFFQTYKDNMKFTSVTFRDILIHEDAYFGIPRSQNSLKDLEYIVKEIGTIEYLFLRFFKGYSNGDDDEDKENRKAFEQWASVIDTYYSNFKREKESEDREKFTYEKEVMDE